MLRFAYCVNLLPYCNLFQAPLTNSMFLPSCHDVLSRSCASTALRLRAFHANAPRLSLPIPPALLNLETKADTASAREWLNAFKVATVPRNMVDLSFARSSGPGGQVCVSPRDIAISHPLTFCTPQNVNKVNTKATVRCHIDAEWIPPWARAELRKSVSDFARTIQLTFTSLTWVSSHTSSRRLTRSLSPQLSIDHNHRTWKKVCVRFVDPLH